MAGTDRSETALTPVHWSIRRRVMRCIVVSPCAVGPRVSPAFFPENIRVSWHVHEEPELRAFHGILLPKLTCRQGRDYNHEWMACQRNDAITRDEEFYHHAPHQVEGMT